MDDGADVADVADEEIEIEDTGGDINWENAEEDLITVEEPNAGLDESIDTTDVPAVDSGEMPDANKPEDPGLESFTPTDEEINIEATADSPSSFPTQDQPQTSEELPATDTQTNTAPSDNQGSSGSSLRGGMEQIATTELALGIKVEGAGIEGPERIYFNNTIESEEGGSGSPERMG